jgi:cytochrome b561/polyisoprenoid-binding protein YceI
MKMARPNISETLIQRRYSSVAILLHWLLALTLAFQMALGFAMPRDASGFAAYQLHKSVGILILVLTLVRIGWRLKNRPPLALEKGFTGFLAKAVHVGFYAVLLLAPLTGWALVSTADIRVPTVLFGTIPLPHLPVPASINAPAEFAHEWLSWIGLGLFALHIAGAIRHHFLIRDDLINRMAPAGSALLVGVLTALVLVTGGATLLLTGGSGAEPLAEVEETVPEQSPLAAAEQAEGIATEDQAAAQDEVAAAEELAAAEDEAAEPGPPPVWAIQPGGNLGFTVSNAGQTVRGSFSDWSGSIRFDPDHPETAEISMSIALTSASVGDATMDGMLKGADFFATAANPTATWRSTSVRSTGPGRYSANGTLSLRGASGRVPLTFTLSGEGLRRRVEGSATIDRTTFGVGTGESAANVGQSVSVSFNFDAVGRAP